MPPWNGQKTPDTGGAYAGGGSSRTSASRCETKSVCPYSLNRQQRPEASHRGPAAATAASAAGEMARTSERNSGLIVGDNGGRPSYRSGGRQGRDTRDRR